MIATDIQSITEKVAARSVMLSTVREQLARRIIGQKKMIDRIFIALLTGGHILLEGVPGLAKTRTISALASAISGSFSRIQFTPDLLPADVTGTIIFQQKTGEFLPKQGPVFANFVLADEINRAPAKVQSSLLEAMQERQVTIGDNTYALPDPFVVLATQNPIEQEGTYPLPEAQVDRFMLKVNVDYPSAAEEKQIVDMVVNSPEQTVQQAVSLDELKQSMGVISDIYMDEKIKDYIISLVQVTRNPEQVPQLKSLGDLIDYGASPRASIYLAQAAKGNAFLNGRGFVTPEDVKEIGYDVLRHRIIVSYEAQAENIDSQAIIKMMFDEIPVP